MVRTSVDDRTGTGPTSPGWPARQTSSLAAMQSTPRTWYFSRMTTRVAPPVPWIHSAISFRRRGRLSPYATSTTTEGNCAFTGRKAVSGCFALPVYGGSGISKATRGVSWIGGGAPRCAELTGAARGSQIARFCRRQKARKHHLGRQLAQPLRRDVVQRRWRFDKERFLLRVVAVSGAVSFAHNTRRAEPVLTGICPRQLCPGRPPAIGPARRRTREVCCGSRSGLRLFRACT